MDFDRSIDPHFHHHVERYDGHRWSVDSNEEYTVYSPSVASRSPSTSALNRFLQEPDAPFHTIATPFQWEGAFASHSISHMLPNNARLPSPAYTSNVSSSWGDRRETPPFASPELCALRYSPFQSSNDDMVPFAFGGNPPIERRDSHCGGCCVAMHDVQRTADEQPDSYHFDDEPASYNSYVPYAQEGYQPMSGDESQSSASYNGTPDYSYSQPIHQRLDVPAPVIRRRRPQSSRNGHSPAAPSRVSRRPHAGRRTSSHRSSEDTATGVSSSGRAFPCPLTIYGCTSSFGSKNEWKRHVTTQHMRLGFWRCDLCGSDRKSKPNDFNRKDLFTQHVRRMHPPDTPLTRVSSRSSSRDPQPDEQYLQEAAKRCYHLLRSLPEDCRCILCEKAFRGQGAWDDRMEHIGRHMEITKKEAREPVDPRDWKIDQMAQQWMLREGILVVNDRQCLELAP